MEKKILCTLALSLLAAPASAHIQLTSPQNRYDDQKLGPCGRGAMDARTSRVTTFRPGETITVTWRETIGHPGHFRIAFDPDGTHFQNPQTADERGGPYVLKDGIADKPGDQVNTYSEQVTLPNLECSNCTLQLIQVMKTTGALTARDIYFQCADLVLKAPESGDAFSAEDLSGRPDLARVPDLASQADPAPPGAGPGCSVPGVAGSPAPMATLLLAAVLLLRRRR